jgi:MoxR-like ATPase
MVIATQNPFEQEGVFPLPESQLDRFLFKVVLDYCTPEEELQMLRLPHRGVTPDVVEEVRPLLDAVKLAKAQAELDATQLPEHVARFIVHLIRETRQVPGVVLGASPRAAIHLVGASKASARLAGRPMVTVDDIAEIAPAVLRHRVIVDGPSPDEVVQTAIAAAHAKL